MRAENPLCCRVQVLVEWDAVTASAQCHRRRLIWSQLARRRARTPSRIRNRSAPKGRTPAVWDRSTLHMKHTRRIRHWRVARVRREYAGFAPPGDESFPATSPDSGARPSAKDARLAFDPVPPWQLRPVRSFRCSRASRAASPTARASAYCRYCQSGNSILINFFVY